MAVASGLVFAASTPPSDFQPGILLGLLGFASSCLFGGRERAGTVRAGARGGFLFGLSANLVALRFVPEVMERFTSLPAIAGWVALVLLSAAQAIPWMIAGGLARWLASTGSVRPFATFGGILPFRLAARLRPDLSRRLEAATRPALPAWFAFGVGVYVATLTPAIFPWTPAGGLSRWPILLQTAELVGERGTSFLLALGCALAAEGLAHMRLGMRAGAQLVAIAAGLFLVLVLYGAHRTRAMERLREAAPHARVALLQPDFDALLRWETSLTTDPQGAMMDRLSALTRVAEDAGAALTVWPESAYPYTLAHGTRTSPRGARAILQQGVHGPVLTGAYMSKGGGVGTNSAILAGPHGAVSPSYDKRHLLWFGETVPLAETFPVLRRIFARGTGLDPGRETVAFEVPVAPSAGLRASPIVAAVLNCYEDTLPVAGREAMSVRPNLLVNVTNDAWFAGSAEGELHLRLAVLRAIETRRDLVRAVNRGPTTFVDATGRVRMRHDSPPGFGPPPPLLAEAALLDAPRTLYSRAGDAPLAALVMAAIATSWRRTRRATSAPPDAAHQ